MTPTAPSPRAWLALINPITCTACAMAFVKEQPRLFSNGISPATEPQVRRIESFWTDCRVTHAHHLWGVKVRVLEGDLPTGRLRILIDQQDLLLREDLARLAEDRDPLLLPWEREAGYQFWATEIVENEADGAQRLGYMLSNGSLIEVWLDLEPLDHPVLLEFELLMNLYDAGNRTLKGVKKA